MPDVLRTLRDFDGPEREAAPGVRVRDRLREVLWPFSEVRAVRTVVLRAVLASPHLGALSEAAPGPSALETQEARAQVRSVARALVVCGSVFHAPADDAAPLRHLFDSPAEAAQLAPAQLGALFEAIERHHADLLRPARLTTPSARTQHHA